jgi:cystathionine beta-lyase
VFSTVNDSFRDISVICTSPSKTFNVAGLQVSNIIIENTELRRRFRKQLNKSGYSQVGLAGLVACEAAYRNGDEWLDAVLAYIKANAVYTRKFVEERLPKVKMSWLEGTYLVWLDFNAYGLADSELNRRMLYDAGLWLDGGSIFGKDGEGFQRINIACPRETLKTALERIEKYF